MSLHHPLSLGSLLNGALNAVDRWQGCQALLAGPGLPLSQIWVLRGCWVDPPELTAPWLPQGWGWETHQLVPVFIWGKKGSDDGDLMSILETPLLSSLWRTGASGRTQWSAGPPPSLCGLKRELQQPPSTCCPPSSPTPLKGSISPSTCPASQEAEAGRGSYCRAGPAHREHRNLPGPRLLPTCLPASSSPRALSVGTSFLSHLPSRDLWQVASTSIKLSLMYMIWGW